MPEYCSSKVSFPGISINFEVCSFCPVWENILTIFESRENEVCFVISAGFELWKSDIALGCPAVQRDKVEKESENKDIEGAKISTWRLYFHIQIWVKSVLLGMWEVSVVISKSEFSKSIWSAVSLDLPPACDQLIQGGVLYWGNIEDFLFLLWRLLTRKLCARFWWFGLLPEARIKHSCNFIYSFCR